MIRLRHILLEQLLPGGYSTAQDNNPFNIIKNEKTIKYTGVVGYKIAKNSGKEFIVFDTLEHGILAGLTNLSKYFTKRNLYTVKDILTTYAGGESTYIAYVTNQLKKFWNPDVTSTTKLPAFAGGAETNVDNIAMFKILAKAIFTFEGGKREFLPHIDTFNISLLPS